MEAKVLTCGCCTNGCTCSNHMDIPSGRPPAKCAEHAAGLRPTDRVLLSGEHDVNTYSGRVVRDDGTQVLVDWKWGDGKLPTLAQLLDAAQGAPTPLPTQPKRPRSTVGLLHLRALMGRDDVTWRVSSLNIEAALRGGAILETEDTDVAGELCTRLILSGGIVAVYPR